MLVLWGPRLMWGSWGPGPMLCSWEQALQMGYGQRLHCCCGEIACSKINVSLSEDSSALPSSWSEDVFRLVQKISVTSETSDCPCIIKESVSHYLKCMWRQIYHKVVSQNKSDIDLTVSKFMPWFTEGSWWHLVAACSLHVLWRAWELFPCVLLCSSVTTLWSRTDL